MAFASRVQGVYLDPMPTEIIGPAQHRRSDPVGVAEGETEQSVDVGGHVLER